MQPDFDIHAFRQAIRKSPSSRGAAMHDFPAPMFNFDLYYDHIRRSGLSTLDRCLLFTLAGLGEELGHGICLATTKEIAGYISASVGAVDASIGRLSAPRNADNPHGGWLIKGSRGLKLEPSDESLVLLFVEQGARHV